MADAATIQQLIDYYVNCLIVQYHDKPKAQATISLLVNEFLCSAILLDIQNGYDIDTAIGHQLDIIGKYVGVDRFYKEVNLIDMFAIPAYLDSPTSPPQYGFETYATFATDNDFNGTLTYEKIVSSNNQLLDEFYRTVIMLKILQNTINHSDAAIDAAMFTFFGGDVRPEEMGNMHMAYFVTANETPLIHAVLYKGLLLRPMAVGAALVQDVDGLMFGFTDYAGFESPYAFGFSTYADYASLPGQVLSYSQISML
jgi:hypothetical protein